jgi:hypothetical protein
MMATYQIMQCDCISTYDVDTIFCFVIYDVIDVLKV